MAGSPDTLTGVLERIIFLNEENHYTIAEFRREDTDEKVTIVGPLPGVQCGETLHIRGAWTRHSQHGDQFKVEAFTSELPSSVHGIRKYLGSGLVPGIGKVYANKIVDAFGVDTFRVLSEESARLRRVPGIGPKRATAIKQAWEDQRALREIHIFLQTYGVTTSQCVKLVNRYGAQAKPLLLAEPYRVAREIEGIGFKTADRIAINLGFANDAPPRLDAGILYALESLQEEGHTAYREADLRDYATDLLQTTAERVAARINALVEAKELVRHQPAGVAHPLPGSAFLQLPVNDHAEQKIAAVVARLTRVASGLPPIKVEAALTWAQERVGFAFHELQATAVRHALTHKFSILTGGPGTGKTSILRALVHILKAKQVRVHLAAPTGRAAQRLTETTGGFASTIHRLLKFDAAKGGFTLNESSPLATDFLIVDEASMLDVRLAAALFAAVPSRAHLLLVGDVDQLPSVGPGNVLKDLIACGSSGVSGPRSSVSDIPVTRLTVIYRQQGQSLIVTVAHAINAGDPQPPPVAHDLAAVPAWSDLSFIAADSAEDCLQKVLTLCTEFIPRHYRRLHSINDVQVLAPMHKGVAGVANLNQQLQVALNPRGSGLRTVSGEFRPGDKLIQLRNNYDKGLFNGDIGAVVSVAPEAGTLVADFDGERHVFERGDFGDIAPAYCISIHKCVSADTLVLTAKGWRQIGNLWPKRRSGVCVRETAVRLAGPEGTVRADQIYRGAIEPAVRVTTRHGFHLTGSHRHPVLVYSPEAVRLVWRKLPKIRPGDYVPIRRGMAMFPRAEVRIAYRPRAYRLRRRISLPKTVSTDIARLLGYLVGDGSYAERKDGDVRLTNANRSLVRDYARIVRVHFGLHPTLSRSTAHKTAPTWYVICKTFREWLAATGLDYVTARQKRVPAAIMASPRAVQAAFLRGLFDTDGSASGNGTRIVLATTSSALAEQVRMMLLNFGIVTTLLHIRASDSWRVEMYGANLRLFEQHIGFGLAAKARQLRHLARRGDGWKGKINVDIIPGAARLWLELRDAIRRRLGPTKGRADCGLFAHSFLTWGRLLLGLARADWQTNYRHLDELLVALGRRWPWVKGIAAYRTLQFLRHTRYFFDPVKQVRATEAAMFDLHVPATHAFVTNGLISHNSQGSEYPVVVIPLLKAHFVMLQRNLLYTALTRGRQKVFLVGEPAAYSIAVRNSESKARCTHLREKLAALEVSS
ncbi:MAG TPA: ATP-dependent RecD-like DNA helicase [Opitutaceae bacterium]|nr:ATP-dependent RecD-like DNA helicase [Opitutaceae bacterium]